MYLSTISKNDIETLRSWRNEIRTTCRQVGIISQSEQEKWFNSLCGDKSRQMFCIVNDNSENIGVGGLTGIDYVHRTAEYSLYIAPNLQRAGYGQRALFLLLDFGFNELNLNCIWGEIFATNKPSIHIAKKIGFKVEGECRQRYFKAGKYVNTIMVSMTAEEWKNILSV